jgi:copper oxidase (laccase) domain-containing protein
MKAEYGTHPKDIRVVCGPSISTESYIKESPEQLKDPAWQPYIRVAASGGTHIDIFGYNKALLIAAGVPEDSITAPLADTVTDTRYFSYYRAVKTGEPQGRIATVAYLQ